MRATRRALQLRRCRNAACFSAAELILRFSCVGTRLHPAHQQSLLLQTFVSFLSSEPIEETAGPLYQA